MLDYLKFAPPALFLLLLGDLGATLNDVRILGSIILWSIYNLDINLSLMSGSDIIHFSEKGKMTPNEGSRGAFEWISRGEKFRHN